MVFGLATGVLQVNALLDNQLSVSPMMVQLPSSLADTYTVNVTLTWRGPTHPAGKVAYQLKHEPAASMTVSNGWYGTAASIQKVYKAADVVFNPPQVVVNATEGESTMVQVRCEALCQAPLLVNMIPVSFKLDPYCLVVHTH